MKLSAEIPGKERDARLPRQVVEEDLPKLLDSLKKDLSVIFGLDIERVFLPLLGDDAVDANEEASYDRERRIMRDTIKSSLEVINLLGLKLRATPLKGMAMTTAGDRKIEPKTIVLDCLEPQKLNNFLKGLTPEDVMNNNLGSSLRRLGERFYEQVCHNYDLASPNDSELSLLKSLPNIEPEFRRLGLVSANHNLTDCAQAIRKNYIKEYASVAQQGIFENDISMRYIDKEESGWYELDWKKIIKALNQAFKNPNARDFVKETANQLLEQARKAREIFSKWQPDQKGYFFVRLALGTLDDAILSLESMVGD